MNPKKPDNEPDNEPDNGNNNDENRKKMKALGKRLFDIMKTPSKVIDGILHTKKVIKTAKEVK